MVSRPGLRAVALSSGLVACGAVANAAWANGTWGAFAGGAMLAVWLGGTIWRAGTRQVYEPLRAPVHEDWSVDRLLLDAVPTPMLMVDGPAVHALNRAARRLFGVDDKLLLTPSDLADPGATHLWYEGRHWRIIRVMLAVADGSRVIVTLVDVEQEERTAEARATSEMIHVLGHELLNGLAPIVSLADSGQAALDGREADPVLLREIFGTLARRAEALQRFTAAYRTLARLPEPSLRPVPVRAIVDDLHRLFAGRWPRTKLSVDLEGDPVWHLDRDQISQALWALLQNAAEASLQAKGDAGHVDLVVRQSTDLIIEVRDDGAGVAFEDETRIFRPFQTTKPDGTGMGLSLARRVAQAHGGLLSLERGQRTTFRMLLTGASRM